MTYSPFPQRISDFIEHLNKKYPDFQHHLNSFFDHIGFSEPFPILESPSFARPHAVKDNIWGMVDFSEDIRRLIDCPLVQRLRTISQTGLTSYTYPTASHTRFSHTLGVFEAATRLLNEIDKTKAHSSEEEGNGLQADQIPSKAKQLLRRAAILHDVGHGPFSHVSEKYFAASSDRHKIGPIPIASLMSDFRRFYFGITEKNTTSGRPSGKKALSELISVIFLCSYRFIKYYDHALSAVEFGSLHDIYYISTLILGDRIEEGDVATPAILSSAIDADKIDYMLRDGSACGISLTIDPSRTFHGAGVYTLSPQDDPYAKDLNYVGVSRLRVFVIDKAGSDTYFQIGISRLSLYNRVYYHPLTRIAEHQFGRLLSTVQLEDPLFYDILIVWRTSEAALLFHRPEASPSKAGALSSAFHWRRFPKRAVNIDLTSISFAFSGSFDTSYEDEFASIVTEKIFPLLEYDNRLIDIIAKRSAQFAKITDGRRTTFNLNYISPGNSSDAIIGNTRLIDRASRRIVKCEFHVPSYLQAGAIADRTGHIVTESGIREIVAVATAYELAQIRLGENPNVTTRGSQDAQTVLNSFRPQFFSFMPIVDLERVSNICKLSIDKIARFNVKLENAYPNDPTFRLINRVRTSTKTRDVVEKFSSFHGARGWRITDAHLVNFISQFPTHLRDQVLDMLLAITVFDRQRICADIQMALQQFSSDIGGNVTYIVPFTMNSGHTTVSYLRDSISMPQYWIFSDSLRAALSQYTDGDRIIFVDDHAASGTQVKQRLKQWVMGDNYLPGDSKLEPTLLQAFMKCSVGFAFAALSDTGADVIREEAQLLGLNLSNVSTARSFDECNLRGVVSDELRSFLNTVGIGLMLPRFDDKVFAKRVKSAQEFALGYRNAEGGLITVLNVPSSTYTALWRPGRYDPTNSYRRAAQASFPWVPLFVRSSQVEEVELF